MISMTLFSKTTEEWLWLQNSFENNYRINSMYVQFRVRVNTRWFQSNFYLELHNELQQGRHTHIFIRSHINIYRDNFKTRKIFDTLQSMNVRYFVLFSVKLVEFWYNQIEVSKKKTPAFLIRSNIAPTKLLTKISLFWNLNCVSCSRNRPANCLKCLK